MLRSASADLPISDRPLAPAPELHDCGGLTSSPGFHVVAAGIVFK
jgi:hypothetical protein